MFNRNITEIYPWNLQMFKNVIAPKFVYSGASDGTMVTTATSLLHNRLPEGKSYVIKLSSLWYDRSIEQNPLSYWDEHYNGIQKEYSMYILQYTRAPSRDALYKVFDAIESHLLNEDKSWTKPEMANKLMDEAGATRVLVNREKVASVILTAELDFARWHFLESILAVCTPKLFVDAPLDSDEKALLKSLTQRTHQSYLNALKRLEARFDIRGAIIEQKIGTFTESEISRRVANAEASITALRKEIEEYERILNSKYERIADHNDTINSLKFLKTQGDHDQELVDLFKTNKSLEIVDVRDGTISFIVRTYFTNFSKSEYKTFRREAYWETLRSDSTPFNTEAVGKLCDALFIDEVMRIKICAYYALTPRSAGYTSITGYGFPESCADYVPNRHLDRHNCFGNYGPMIRRELERGDVVGAVIDCIASASSVNMHESSIFAAFMKNAFNLGKKCFALPDGSSVNAVDALKWVEAREAQRQAEETVTSEDAGVETPVENTRGENGNV